MSKRIEEFETELKALLEKYDDLETLTIIHDTETHSVSMCGNAHCTLCLVEAANGIADQNQLKHERDDNDTPVH